MAAGAVYSAVSMFASGVRAFASGVRASLHITPTLRRLADSKTARKGFRNTYMLNCTLIVVDVTSTWRLPQALARLLCVALLGDPPTSRADAYARVADAVASVLLFSCAVLPLVLSSLLFSSRWARQMLPGSTAHESSDTAGPLLAFGKALFQTALLLVMALQAILLDALPVMGRPLAIALTAAVMGFNAYDLGRLSVDGVRAVDRLSVLEASLAWFIGFGFWPALASYFWSAGVNMGVYGLAYPFLVLAALGAGNGAASGGPGRLQKLDTPAALPVLLPFKWSVLLLTQLLIWCTRRCSCSKRKAPAAPARSLQSPLPQVKRAAQRG
jgi:hypothetical protein